VRLCLFGPQFEPLVTTQRLAMDFATLLCCSQALLTSHGIVALSAEDLVEGDRERTLAMLWTVALSLQLPALLPLPTLRAELQRLLATARQAPGQKGRTAGGRGGHVPLAVYLTDERICLLMEWVQAVCLHYGVPVQNFTTSFADGRVLCLLVGGSTLAGSGTELRARWLHMGGSCMARQMHQHDAYVAMLHPVLSVLG
jgi:hypothetical protein